MLRQSFERVRHRFTPPHPYSYRHHFISFLLLHELTAILPLPIFAYSYYHLLPHLTIDHDDFFSNWNNHPTLRYFHDAYDKMTQYLRKKEWDAYISPRGVVACGMAYGTVKVLMPLRMMASVYWTPSVTRRLVGPVVTMWIGNHGRIK